MKRKSPVWACQGHEAMFSAIMSHRVKPMSRALKKKACHAEDKEQDKQKGRKGRSQGVVLLKAQADGGKGPGGPQGSAEKAVPKGRQCGCQGLAQGSDGGLGYGLACYLHFQGNEQACVAWQHEGVRVAVLGVAGKGTPAILAVRIEMAQSRGKHVEQPQLLHAAGGHGSVYGSCAHKTGKRNAHGQGGAQGFVRGACPHACLSSGASPGEK